MNPYQFTAEGDQEQREECHTFRSSLIRTSAVILTCTIPFSVVALFFVDGFDTNIPLALGALLVNSLLGIALTATAVAYFKVYVFRDRIRGYDTWGFYHDVWWQDIETIRPINLLSLQYMRVYSRSSPRVIWIPSFLTNMDRFRQLVSQYASPDNPLNMHLSQRVTESLRL